MRGMHSVFISSILFACLLSGCATNPVTGKQDFVLMSESQEIRMGQRADQQVKKDYALYDLNGLQSYVNDLGQRLAKAGHRPQLDYRFIILDTPEINAFALPGGYIYITRGILAYLNSEAELAAVLGHEIGHVNARHSVRQYTAATGANVALSIISSIFTRGQAANLGQNVLSILGTAILSGYGREHELEADRLGAEYLARLGYDPQAMINVIRVLKNQELFDAEIAKQEGRKPRAYHGVFATHPDNDTRLKEVVAEAVKLSPNKKEIHSAVYLTKTNGMIFADSATQGVVRNGNFYHKELGIALKLPENWRVQNKPEKLQATSPAGEAVIEMTLQNRPKISPVELLNKVFGAMEETNLSPINNLIAAQGKQIIPSRALLASAIYLNDKAFLITGITKDASLYNKYSAEMLASMQSFHKLTENEHALAQPLQIKLIVADNKTRFADLAKKSPLGKNAEGYLRLINALYPNGEPQPGQSIKVIE